MLTQGTATEARFEYWRQRLSLSAKQKEQAEHNKTMGSWPNRKIARSTLRLQMLENAGTHYKQRLSIKGKSPYIFHKQAQFRGGKPLPLLNVVHVCEDENPAKLED